jgi:pyruvate dehydrogenase complex dihydrolipoamide acetyltransferase long form
LSHSKGLDATTLEGTGKGGRVTKGDFLLALEKGTYMPPLTVAHVKSLSANEAVAPPQPTASSATNVAPPTPPVVPPLSLASLPPLEVSTYGTYNDITNSGMRKVIARRLTESKSQVPHYYTSMEVELDQVLALRKQLAKNHDVKVSVNDLVIRCSAMALRDVPQVNATFDPKSQSIELQSNIDISVAVATPNGLITPIVPNTDRLGLEAISSKVRELAARARDGKLLPHEYQGGTFCVTNLGMFGIDEFSAVINPPQAAILAVGGGSRQVVPSPYVDGAEEQAKPTVKTIMTARLSADRRVVDEPTAALFLSAFRRYINQPELLLL